MEMDEPNSTPHRALAVDTVIHCSPEPGAQALQTLGFRVQMAPQTALCLVIEFGDNSDIQMRIQNMSDENAVTTYHQYLKEGNYMLRAVIYNECHGAEVELGPYYVEVSQEATSVSMNSSSIHADEVLVFGASPNQKSTVVMHQFHSILLYNVSFISQTQLANSQVWSSVTVYYQLQPISVYTNGTVFATDTNITFVAVTMETTPLEFMWYFGDDPPVRTTSRIMKKRFIIPQWHHVVVRASNGLSSVASEPHRIRVQRRIVANRLVSTSSALVNVSVAFECRINFGTDVAFRWHFGDGAVSVGNSSINHVYSREGEFTVEVLAFNSISATSLRKNLFIVSRPCQPPPVKNLGPQKVQVWRSQPIELRVTFEAPMLCDISQGLTYSWSLQSSAGLTVPLPPAVHTHRQTLTVPGYFLEPGNYTALAKVQVEGSVVYSNYCVQVEVRARAPVSVISEGTHLFISRTLVSTITLRGSQSHDPDYPGAILSYQWRCTVASTPGHPCLAPSSSHSWNARAPALVLTTSSLSDSHDQFLILLTVSSGGRNSSEAQVFLSTRVDPALRWVHISWINFKDVLVNWNEELSLRAECEDCGEVADLSYSWDLFLVNATEKNNLEGPFCRTVGLLGSSRVGAVSRSFAPKLTTVKPDQLGTNETIASSLWEPSPQSPGPYTPGRPAFWGLGRTPKEATGSSKQAPVAGDTSALEAASWGEESLVFSPSPSESPSSPSISDFEAYYSDIQEAEPSRGRQPGTSLPGAGPSMSEAEYPGDGDNLVDPLLLTSQDQPLLLVDWPKSLLSRAIFHSYTSSGITGRAVMVKPYALSPGETYVLQASVASKHNFLGKAQLYLTVSQAPRGVSCHVQPPHGLEAHTIFSVFCMSGRPDFRYEFSYRIGNSPKHTLYRGRDTQYYFALPGGEPSNNYKVLVSTEVTDGQGSQVQPCTVEVTVLPRFHGNHCPSEDLYNSSLENLSTLQLMGSSLEIRNYVTMLTKVLSRWVKEDGSSLCVQWPQMQDAFISSVCRLTLTNQEDMIDTVLTLNNLIRFMNKLSFMSGVLILKYAQTLLTQSQSLGKFMMDKSFASELIFLVSGVLEVSDKEKSRNVNYLRGEGTKIISDLLLSCLCLNEEHGFHVSTGQMEFLALLHHNQQSSVQNLGSVQVHLPADVAGLSPAGTEMQSPCYVSHLMFFKKNLYGEGQAPGQTGQTVALSLFNCSSRRPISRQRLKKPVTVEFGAFGEEDLDSQRNKTAFVLLRDKVNFHKFTGFSEKHLESLQMRIEFSKPIARAFPVLLLVRFSEKPTPSDFLVKQIYLWDGHVVHIHIPAALRKDTSSGYLSMLDADYDRKPQNKYFAEAVNYTVHFQWIQCLFWDTKGWKSERFSPQPGTSPEKVNCSYDRLAAFTIARRQLNASFEVSDISKLQRHPENLLPSTLMVVTVILYALLATKSRQVDLREKKKMGPIFLQENSPGDRQLYAVVIDTGFRAPARFTAKVYIVLCGENGISEPKELYSPEKPLFESNSRHTFILRAPARLGPLRTLRLWHDSCGACPAWYISHVMVEELHVGRGWGQGRCWFFPAECWLAAGRQDGHVDRELPCLQQGPGFWKLLYSVFTEYLEDFHVWLSVYSRPSPSGFLHSQRLAVASTLLCLYSCLAALLIAVGQEQLPLGVGPTDNTFSSFQMGFLLTLLASPGAQLLSLLFRLSKGAKEPSGVEPSFPLRGVKTDTAQGTLGSSNSAQLPTPCTLSSVGLEHSTKAHSPYYQGEFPGMSSEGLPTPQKSWAPLPWLGSAAWLICGTVSVACGVGTGLLGYRFRPEQCVQWLHLLASSMLCCALLTQPLLISLVALGFAWKRKDDKHFFTSSLRVTTQALRCKLAGPSEACWPPSYSCSVPQGTCEVEQVLATRQRARRLRQCKVHPPSEAQLRAPRARMRRQIGAQQALRSISMYLLMLLLFLVIVYGKLSQGEYFLNQAIRNEFTRGAGHSSSGPRSMDEWWHWSLTTLLDGLYQGDSSAATSTPGTQPRALGGKCSLLGTLTIRQLRHHPESLCKLPSSLSAPTQDSLSTCNPTVEDPETPLVTDPEAARISSHPALTVILLCRPASRDTLTKLRASGWIDGSTRAVSLHFSLYNPPTRLFSSVSLNAELLPEGGLTFSPLVESFTIFPSDSSPRYHLILTELLFLVLSVIHFCFECYDMIEKGTCSYWRKPRSWLKVSIVGVSLAYLAASSYRATLAGEVTDQFQKGCFQGFTDLSHMALWNQRSRWLQGILSFLLMGKCVCLLGIQKTMAPGSFKMGNSFSSIFTPGLIGVLTLAVHHCLHRFLLSTGALPSGTLADTFRDLPFQFPGRSQNPSFLSLSRSDQQAAAWCYGVLSIAVAILWFGMVCKYPPGLVVRVCKGFTHCVGISISHFHDTGWISGPSFACGNNWRRGRDAWEGVSYVGHVTLQSGVFGVENFLKAAAFGDLITNSKTLSNSWKELMLRVSMLMAFAQKRKSFQSKFLVRLKDVKAYLWEKAHILLGLEEPIVEDTEMAEDCNYYLDECSDLLDELLLKIDGLSDSLQLPFLQQQSKSASEARVEDGSLLGVSAPGKYSSTPFKMPYQAYNQSSLSPLYPRNTTNPTPPPLLCESQFCRLNPKDVTVASLNAVPSYS
ncbi:polycystin-1-like protein 1 [Erinaceus europaeus]|uniref:Polycystin-1-like protein 1 n=1 Tax=Erinaceus europaeus TaxID=9365 RepID=A0ABM3VRN0_ERIEU|nr:polycystin-1-like protein 1 [Erinaceus europaeus]